MTRKYFPRYLNFILMTLLMLSCICSPPQALGQGSGALAANEKLKGPQFDPKTGVKLDIRFLPPTSAHKAVYKPETEPVVVVGEVVDAWCYASQTMGAGHGPVHQHCAVACVGGGVTPGILDDNGKLWICVKHKAFTGCKELLFPFVARRVKVTGWAAHKGGCNVLKIEKVELEKASK